MPSERENRVTFRISNEELKILEVAAKKDDRSVSSFVRVHILEVAREKFSSLAEREKWINKEIELDEKERDLADRRMAPPQI
jgi:uncharacterized protein (DUF1778 family)